MSEQYNDDNFVVMSKEQPKQAQTIDIQFILKLIKNPMEALKLDGKKDLLYGLVGIGASLLGYLVWVLVLNSYLKDLFRLIFAPLTLLTGGGGGAGLVIGKLILLGILSLVALFVSLWLLSWWQSSERQSIPSLATKLGGMQYTSGVGFIVAALIGLISIKLSFAILLITLISTIVWSIIGMMQLNQVKGEKSFLFITGSVAAYFVIMLVLSSILL